MYTGVALKAFLIFVTTLGLGLIGLFQTQGVVNFSDITPLNYTIAFIQALLAAVAVVQSQISDSPANVKQADDLIKAAAFIKSEQGFARIWTLIVMAVGVCALMIACGHLTPRKTIGATSEVIEELAIQVDQLQKDGHITNEQEDRYMDELKRVNGDLRTATFLVGDQKTASLEAVNQRLLELKNQLREVKK